MSKYFDFLQIVALFLSAYFGKLFIVFSKPSSKGRGSFSFYFFWISSSSYSSFFSSFFYSSSFFFFFFGIKGHHFSRANLIKNSRNCGLEKSLKFSPLFFWTDVSSSVEDKQEYIFRIIFACVTRFEMYLCSSINFSNSNYEMEKTPVAEG